MQHRRTSRRAPKALDNGAAWISYSDMMASLLLLFIMVLVYSIYQYFVMLDTKTKEITEKQNQLDISIVQIDEQKSILDTQKSKLDEQNVIIIMKENELAKLQQELDDKKILIDTKSSELETQNALLLVAQSDLSKRENELKTANIKLQETQKQISAQQTKIDNLIGIRTKIIEDLSNVLAQNNLKASVDKNTGDITLDSAVFFETGKADIKDTGKELLNKFLPAYFSVLMREEYKDYLGEIIVEGHTDTVGSYFLNLDLSQKRALSVVKYCLEMPSLTASQNEYLRTVLTSKGKSFSSPVLNSDGTVNMDKSRRVEFKFRLKDSEMIIELNKILNKGE